MMKKVMTGLLSLVMLVMVIACSDDPVSSDSTNLRVLDSLGNPVAGAKIVVSYYREVFDETGVIKIIDPEEKDSALTINFSVASTSPVELEIQNYYTKEKTVLLISGTMLAGYHTITWSGKNSNGKYVFNDVYDCVLDLNGQILTKQSLVTYDYLGALESEIEYIANTKSDGSFYFNAAGLIKDYEGEYVDDDVSAYVRFANYVKLWIVKDGYENACIDSFDLMGANDSLEIVL
ncbi:MAG: hypothetical protein PF574_08485 [Candidatus Delongbacteria bacterium]|nr:hypothetical protein [Candidatus Delongbacteria bacterium]